MKIHIALLLTLLSFGQLAKAGDKMGGDILTIDLGLAPKKTETSDRVHFTIADTICSRYWGSIVGGIFYTGGPVNFTDFSVTVDDAWGSTYALIGMINPLDTTKYDYQGGTEYYAGIGRTFNLWKGGEKNLPLVRLNAFVLYDAISRVERYDDDVFQEYLRIDFLRVPFAQPYFEGYHWDKIGKNSPPVGFFARAGVHREQPLGFSLFGHPMCLGIDLSAGYSGEIFNCSPGLAYYRLGVCVPVQLSKHFKVVPSFIGQIAGGGQQVGREFVDHSRGFYNLRFQYDF